MKLALLLTIILPIVLSKPTVNLDLDLELNREGATFDDVLGRVQDDLASVAKSKVALLNVLASSAVNTASDVGTRTAEVGASAVASVNVDNLESAINATEDVIKANKVAMIETVFDAKRKLLHGIQSIPGQINGERKKTREIALISWWFLRRESPRKLLFCKNDLTAASFLFSSRSSAIFLFNVI